MGERKTKKEKERADRKSEQTCSRREREEGGASRLRQFK